MTYTNKFNKCIFYTSNTNQFIQKYSSKYTILILKYSVYFLSFHTLYMTDGYLKNYV